MYSKKHQRCFDNIPSNRLPILQGKNGPISCVGARFIVPAGWGAVPHLAPTRAYPPPTPPRATTFQAAPLPRLSRHRLVAGRRPSTCSGTGRLSGRGRPLWVPGLATAAILILTAPYYSINSARRTVTACPPNRTRSPITRTRTTPPRAEA